MKKIPLTQGQVALVDDDDYTWLSLHRWFARWSPKSQTFYAARNIPKRGGGQTSITMHRQILELKPGQEADHKDGDGLNNTRENIRPCVKAQNQWNRGPQKTNTSGYKGVCFYPLRGKWLARISVFQRRFCLGYHRTKVAAARAYDAAARRLHGEFARLNLG